MLIIGKDISFENFIAIFKEKNFFIFDTETTGLNPYADSVPFLLQIGLLIEGELKVFMLGLDEFGCNEKFPFILSKAQKDILAEAFLERMKSRSIFIAHNIKFDLHMLFQYFKYDIYNSKNICCDFYDTMVHFKVLNNYMFQVSLESCCEFYKISKKDDGVKEWISKNKKKMKDKNRYDFVDFNIMLDYAAQDIVSTFELYKAIQKQCQEYIDQDIIVKESLLNVLKIEINATKSLFFIERRGLKIDLEHVKKCADYYNKKLFEYEIEFMNLMERNSPLGAEFFTDSNDEIERYYEYCGIELKDKNENGKALTSEAFLLRYPCELTNIILEIRSLRKTISTYIKPLKDLNIDGVIRPTYFQCGADTLRMSVKDPAIQTIPRDDGEFGLRRCFIARKGLLYSVDYAAQEARIALIASGEHELLNKVLNEGLDMHAHNAKIMRTSRQNAKGVFFGFLYGSGIATITKGLNTSYDEAKKIKYALQNAMPRLKRFNYALKDCVDEHGYLVTCFGNPLYIKNKIFSYRALNYKIQGTGAIMMKKCLHLWDQVANEVGDGYPLICIHDEIISEFENEPSEEIKKRFTDCFRASFEHMDAEFSEGMKEWRKC